MKDNYTKIIELQNEFSKKVITYDYLNNNNNIRNVCGIDVSYKDLNEKSTISYPYIPGLFMWREGEPLLKIVRLLKNAFDVLLMVMVFYIQDSVVWLPT